MSEVLLCANHGHWLCFQPTIFSRAAVPLSSTWPPTCVSPRCFEYRNVEIGAGCGTVFALSTAGT